MSSLNSIGTIPAATSIPDNEWGRLALHLASDHADPMAPQRGLAENQAQHAHEHAGPGTIRNHPAGSMHFDLKKAQANILEMLQDNGKLYPPVRKDGDGR